MTRHRALNDVNIPDFTATRASDRCLDILELKQPFTRLFKRDGTFSAEFNGAWNQAERYLAFVQKNRSHLLAEKDLRFDNPIALLVLGSSLNDRDRQRIVDKVSLVSSIRVLTFDEIIRTAEHLLTLMKAASQRVLELDSTQHQGD